MGNSSNHKIHLASGHPIESSPLTGQVDSISKPVRSRLSYYPYIRSRIYNRYLLYPSLNMVTILDPTDANANLRSSFSDVLHSRHIEQRSYLTRIRLNCASFKPTITIHVQTKHYRDSNGNDGLRHAGFTRNRRHREMVVGIDLVGSGDLALGYGTTQDIIILSAVWPTLD